MVSSFTAKLMSLEKVINHLSSANSQQEIPAEFWIPTMITYFKLSFELSWKVMKKHMQDRFIDSATTGSPRDIIKLAYKEHYIDNEQLWLDMLEDKNIMEHRYDDEISADMLERVAVEYLPEFKRLLHYLQSLPTDLF